MTCLWHEFTSYDVGVCELIWYHEVIYNMMLVPFSNDWNHHVKLLATNLCWLRKNGLPIHMAVRETDNVYTLENKYIDAILHMDWPCNATELCIFIGYVNFCCTCCRVAHISLNRIDPWFDNLLHGQANCRKHLYNALAYDCKSIACPDHNKWFSIHANASDFQLGTCIIQGGRPVAYFSCNWQCHSKIILHLEQ